MLMASHPPWLVIAVVVSIVALGLMLLGRLMRALGLLLFVLLGAAGVWYGWQRLQGEDPLAGFDARASGQPGSSEAQGIEGPVEIP